MSNDGESEVQCMLNAVGSVWQSRDIVSNTQLLGHESAALVHLPPYPFEHRRFFLDKPYKRSSVEVNTKYGQGSPELIVDADINRTSCIAIFKSLWMKYLGVNDVNEHDNFYKCGGDSLIAVGLFAELSSKLRLSLSTGLLLQYATFHQLLLHIDSLLIMNLKPIHTPSNVNDASPLVVLQKGNSSCAIILVHAVGGEVISYMDLVNCMDVDTSVYAFRAVSVDGTAPPYTSIRTMATAYVKELMKCLGSSQYTSFQLGGSSFGGIVAYEMSQQLHELGIRQASLFLIDSPCPGSTIDNMLPPTRLTCYAEVLDYLFGDMFQFHLSSIVNLNLKEQLAFIRERADLLNISSSVLMGITHALLDTWIAHAESMWDYVPDPYFEQGRIIYFSHEISTTRYSTLAAPGWRMLVSPVPDAFSEFVTPGSHTTMYMKPNVTVLCDLLHRHTFQVRLMYSNILKLLLNVK